MVDEGWLLEEEEEVRYTVAETVDDSATSRWARNLLSSSNAVQIYMKTFAKMGEFPFAENQFDFGECETVYIFSLQSVGCTSDM